MGNRRFPIIFSLICVAWLWPGSTLLGQPRVQLPSESPVLPSTAPYTGGVAPYGTGAPYGTTPTYSTPSATSFDPYFRPSTPAPMFNSPNWNLGNLFNWYNSGQTSAPVIPLGPANYPSYVPSGTTPPYNSPQTFSSSQTNPWAPPPGYYPNSVYPNSIYPNSTPNVLFPGTSNQSQFTNWNYNNLYTNPSLTSLSSSLSYGTNEVVRLCQGARFRHTWLNGTGGFNSKDANSLEQNDTDVSLVFAIPDFLNSTRSFYIIPSYSHHLWDGPRVAGSDLPSKAFSGFLDFGWDTNPMQTLGLELGGRIGVFADFDAINSDSVRYQGKILGRLRLTPTSTFRLGVFYLDRNKIKLLPAGGLLWTPNQDSRFDLFFPEPKVSHYVATLGNKDMWWYLHGYYGGGNWTIQRTDQSEDEIDINDLRVMIGLEFGQSEQIRQGFRSGFIELGYAFNRELIFRHNSANNLELDDSIVVRAGFAY